MHDDLEVTNNMKSKTTGAINLGPTGNVQGTHRFLSLKARETIVRRNWTELPVPIYVITRLRKFMEEPFKGSNNTNEFDEESLSETNTENNTCENQEKLDDGEVTVPSQEEVISEEIKELEETTTTEIEEDLPNQELNNEMIEENEMTQVLPSEKVVESSTNHDNNLRKLRARD